MIKQEIVCDVCNKDISATFNDRGKLTASGFGVGLYEIFSMDICKDCLTKIQGLIIHRGDIIL